MPIKPRPPIASTTWVDGIQPMIDTAAVRLELAEAFRQIHGYAYHAEHRTRESLGYNERQDGIFVAFRRENLLAIRTLCNTIDRLLEELPC